MMKIPYPDLNEVYKLKTRWYQYLFAPSDPIVAPISKLTIAKSFMLVEITMNGWGWMTLRTNLQKSKVSLLTLLYSVFKTKLINLGWFHFPMRSNWPNLNQIHFFGSSQSKTYIVPVDAIFSIGVYNFFGGKTKVFRVSSNLQSYPRPFSAAQVSGVDQLTSVYLEQVYTNIDSELSKFSSLDAIPMPNLDVEIKYFLTKSELKRCSDDLVVRKMQELEVDQAFLTKKTIPQIESLIGRLDIDEELVKARMPRIAKH
jgi:hypothetical protein